MMRFLAFTCFSLLSFYVMAESTLPMGCQAIAVQGEEIEIKAKKSSLIFIHNLTTTDLWVTHPVKNAGASAGWTTQLKGGNWAALSLKKGPFALNCIESRPGHEQQVPCKGEIAVCKWNAKKVKMPADAQGSTFWAAEDMSLDALIAAVGTRGFDIRLSDQKK